MPSKEERGQMMNGSQQVEQERSVLRWGGLAGLLGGILFILSFVVVIAGPVGMEDPADLGAEPGCSGPGVLSRHLRVRLGG